ncbi:MAG TPA: amino acid adenylation domain-containing protein, partial [Steroidobacteraceae bacterium]|nr:amino acid adenylation domain-containing protein [Steroidobacteraceae bacterium]
MEGTTKGSGGNSGDQPDRGRLPKLRADEHEKVVHRFTDTASVCLRDRLIQELFEEQVRRTPDAIGVTHEERQQTYAELNAGANQLARYLLNEGAGPDRLIGVCIERSVQMVISLLGILKAGCAYVPLDPDYPAERLQYMLEDAGPQMVLTEEHLRAALPMTRAKMIVLPAKLQEISGYRDENLSAAELGLRADNLAYVIYTSGSTGQPKGTAMSHRSMVNLIEWHRRSFCTRGLQRVLQFAALSFDVAFQEVFSTLSTGCSLVLPDEWIRRDVGALMRFLGSRRIQRLFVPPLVLQSLAAYFRSTGALPESLEDVITAGEQLRISPEISHFFKHLKGCRLHNHYGPTETHVVTALTLTGDPGDWSSLPPIGGPIANAQVYVLDEGGKPATVGVEGEIHIGGAGMARGYLRKPDLTAQRFLPDPFSADPHSRLYRTGDLGRWQPDGMLEFLGRNDEQVKIRGFRIELAEI